MSPHPEGDLTLLLLPLHGKVCLSLAESGLSFFGGGNARLLLLPAHFLSPANFSRAITRALFGKGKRDASLVFFLGWGAKLLGGRPCTSFEFKTRRKLSLAQGKCLKC